MARCTFSLTLCTYVRETSPVVATWTVPTCLSVACLAAKPMPDLRCVPSQKASPPIESAGVTLWM